MAAAEHMRQRMTHLWVQRRARDVAGGGRLLERGRHRDAAAGALAQKKMTRHCTHRFPAGARLEGAQ